MRKFSNTNSIILTLTRRCQFNCRYCHMSRTKSDISVKNMRKAIDLLLTSSEESLTVQFFGGEPMLRFDLIKKAVEYGNRQAENKNKRINYVITTNGLLLDRKSLSYASRHDITFMFSLDGGKHSHDKNRIASNKKSDYYPEIIKNIYKAHAYGCNYYINMTVDTEEVGNLTGNYFALLKAGFRNVHITYVLGKIWPEKKQAEYINAIIDIEKRQKERFPYLAPFFYDYLNEPFFSSPVIVVDVDGKIDVGCSLVLENLLPRLQANYYQGTLDNIKNINPLRREREEHLFNILYEKKIPSKEKKIITNNLSFGMKIKKETRKIFNREQRFSFMEMQLSSRCQFDCEYCELDRSMPDMKEEALYQGIDFLFTSKSEIVRLQFFGGEPLLSFDLIKKGVEYANRKAGRQKKQILYYLATNALALNGRIADFLQKNCFSIIISLDGDIGIQAKNRPLLTHDSIDYPYDTLVSNIKLLADRGVDFFVNLVVTPDDVHNLGVNARYIFETLKTEKLMISYALGKTWQKNEIEAYFNQIEGLERFLSGNKIMNYENEDEPVIAADSINMDYRGGLFRGCVLSMVKTFANLRSINYLGNIKEYDSINELEGDRIDLVYNIITANFSDKYEKEKVLNNLKMGFIARRFFNK